MAQPQRRVRQSPIVKRELVSLEMACVIAAAKGWGEACPPDTSCAANLECNAQQFCQNLRGDGPVYGRPCFGKDTSECNVDATGAFRLQCLPHKQSGSDATFMRCGCTDDMNGYSCGPDADKKARVCDKTQAVNMPDLPKI
jgi:hypothetical protein